MVLQVNAFHDSRSRAASLQGQVTGLQDDLAGTQAENVSLRSEADSSNGLISRFFSKMIGASDSPPSSSSLSCASADSGTDRPANSGSNLQQLLATIERNTAVHDAKVHEMQQLADESRTEADNFRMAMNDALVEAADTRGQLNGMGKQLAAVQADSEELRRDQAQLMQELAGSRQCVQELRARHDAAQTAAQTRLGRAEERLVTSAANAAQEIGALRQEVARLTAENEELRSQPARRRAAHAPAFHSSASTAAGHQVAAVSAGCRLVTAFTAAIPHRERYCNCKLI